MGQRRSQREIRKYLEMNEHEKTTHQNLGVAKAVFRGKCITVNICIFKNLKSRIEPSTLRNLEKEQNKPKASRRKEIIRIRVEINEMESLKTEKNQ